MKKGKGEGLKRKRNEGTFRLNTICKIIYDLSVTPRFVCIVDKSTLNDKKTSILIIWEKTIYFNS